MKWMLVVLAFGAPLKTGILFENLGTCLAAEASMRDEVSRTIKQESTAMDEIVPYLEQLRGVCIPYAAPPEGSAK